MATQSPHWRRRRFPGADAGFEGGRWYERGDSGAEADWGRVLTWRPPAMLRLSWQVSAQWQPDPSIATVVELRFLPEGAGRTRLELEHVGFEHYGAQAEAMQAMFDSPGGWSGILEALPEALGG
ncbi:SRPBCC domain-containing protein [Roseateles cellulosilyticus]|uniref:SRPBCC domain-containing protein n=1 Tax=Pelomonas cellulosilytica TaxID=2906762 RepID=A0ABS8XYC4_9BURK|nr:SRPBCC domain-containing protein [Pelomonas sp. P8]